MEKARYTVKALADECGVSVQSIYSLKKNNDELRELCEAHASRVKGANSYGPAVLEWLLAYYQKAPAQPLENVEQTDEAEELLPRPEVEELLEATLKIKDDEIAELQNQIKQKDELILKLTNLLEDMSNQKNHILMLLGEEQQQVKLLEAPKEGIIKRLTKMFTKKTTEKK